MYIATNSDQQIKDRFTVSPSRQTNASNFSALLGIHIITTPLGATTGPLPALQDCAPVASVSMEVLHLVPCFPLRLLDTSLENKHLVLFSGVRCLRVTKRSLYPLEDLHIILQSPLVADIGCTSYG